MVRRRLLPSLLLLLVPVWAQGQAAPRVLARFAPGTVPGTVRYQVLVEGLARTDVQPHLGALGNLLVVGGPFMSQEIAWENQATSALTTITWVMRAPHPGPISVAPTTLAIGDLTLTTSSVSGRAFVGELTGDGAAGPHLELEVSRSRVTVGEAFTAEFTLRANGPAATADWEVVPRFPASWSEPLPANLLAGAAAARSLGRRTVAGWVVIPAHAGHLEIPAASARPSPEGDDQPLVPATTLTSQPTTVEVDPLPAPPQGYFGVVGEVTITRALAPADVHLGDVALVDFEVKGKGNFPLMSEPPCELPPGLRSFPAEQAQQWKASRDGLVGSRSWRIPVVADRAGRFVIPAMSLATFVPGKGYQRQALPALALMVDGSTATSDSGRGAVVPALGRGSGWLPWTAGALAGAALLAAVSLGWRRRLTRRLSRGGGTVEAQLEQLQKVLETWGHRRFGVGPEAGESALVLAGCPPRLASEVAALHAALRRARVAPGLSDPAETLAALRARLEQFLASHPTTAARIAG